MKQRPDIWELLRIIDPYPRHCVHYQFDVILHVYEGHTQTYTPTYIYNMHTLLSELIVCVCMCQFCFNTLTKDSVYNLLVYNLFIYMYVCMHVCMYVYMRDVRIYVCTYVCYVYMYVCMCVCRYSYLFICIYCICEHRMGLRFWLLRFNNPVYSLM